VSKQTIGGLVDAALAAGRRIEAEPVYGRIKVTLWEPGVNAGGRDWVSPIILTATEDEVCQVVMRLLNAARSPGGGEEGV